MDLMSYVWERSGLVSDCRMLIVDFGFLNDLSRNGIRAELGLGAPGT